MIIFEMEVRKYFLSKQLGLLGMAISFELRRDSRNPFFSVTDIGFLIVSGSSRSRARSIALRKLTQLKRQLADRKFKLLLEPSDRNFIARCR